MPERRLILTFHGIGDPPPHVAGSERGVWISRDLYEATLDEASKRSDVLITFDDGNRSDVAIGLPELRLRGLKATFFVVADRLDEPGYLTRDELRELSAAGMTVGSHGLHHRSWRPLSDDDLRDDLERARSVLEGVVASPVTEVSCPFGEYDRRVLRQLRRVGHERVYTSDGGTSRTAAWLQHRNTVDPGWEPPRARLDAREPARVRLVRSAKRVAKRWR
jgi:peptidoglycan/xylan/chitin deacetylase (PgdA/CDA1 family)